MKYSKKLHNQLIGAFIFTTFSISTLYGIFVFNAMKYTEDDILNRRVNLEIQYFIDQYTKDKSTAKLPHSTVVSGYLSSSTNLPEWLKDQPPGTREIHDKEVHIGVKKLPVSDNFLYITVSEVGASNLENEASTLLMVLIFIGAIITLIGLLIGFILSKYISTPLIVLTSEIEQYDERSQLPFSGFKRNDEVGALSRAFTESVQRSRKYLEREKQFTRYASHELRTPVAIIKNSLAVLNLTDQTQATQSRNLKRIEYAAYDMESLIKTFLLLGREQQKIKLNSVNIETLLNKCLKKYQNLNLDKELNITVDTEGPVLIQCKPQLVSILLNNVVRNIYQHCDVEARIELTNQHLIFENNIVESVRENAPVSNAFGLEIIEMIGKLCNFNITKTIEDNMFKITIIF